MTWTDDQLRAIETRGSSVLVSAAAGSGKTAVLVERLLRRIEKERLDITEFLIITYTKAAAGELRRKISEALSERVAQNPKDKHLRRQLALVGSARISTVHSFCTWVLRNYGTNDALSGGFRVLDEVEAKILLENTLRELLEEKYVNPTAEFRALANYMSDSRSDGELYSSILELYKKSMSHPYPKKWLEFIGDTYDIGHITDVGETVWGKSALESAEGIIGNAKKNLSLLLRDAEESEELSSLYGATLRELLGVVAYIPAKSWDEFRKRAETAVLPNLPSSRKVEDKAFTNRIKEIKGQIKKDIDSIYVTVLPAQSSVLLDEIRALRPIVRTLADVTCELIDVFETEKITSGKLDYSDLEHQTINVLIEGYDAETDTVTPSETALEISEIFAEILLDEFQDSNIIQDILFRAVSRDEKNIVMVGDVKQSIYGFRLADPTIFMKKYKDFVRYEEARGDEPRRITLAKNFRSRAEILDASNAIFSRVMSEELGGVDYNGEHFLVPRDNIPMSEREGMECELCIIDVGDDKEEKEIYAEARFTAQKIRSLIDSGFEICGKDGNAKRVTYRDFAVLLRSVKNVSKVYEQIFTEYGIPFTSPTNEGILTKSEVNAILSYLSVIDNPTADIQLLATLRSPLFSFSADDLCEIRRSDRKAIIEGVKKLSLEDSEVGRKCKAFLSLTSALRARSRGMSAGKLIWEVYNKTNALGIFGAMPCGEERQENLIELYKSAEALDALGYTGLYKFLSHIASLAEKKGDIAKSQSGDANAVTIMTVHKSKGLEFPIVFVGNAFKKFNMLDLRNPVLIHQKMGVGLNFRSEDEGYECSTLMRETIKKKLMEDLRSEEMRLLYVALTRAREKLYITGGKCKFGQEIQNILNLYAYQELDRENLARRNNAEYWLVLPLIRSVTGNTLLEYSECPPSSGDALSGLRVNVIKKEELENETVACEGEQNEILAHDITPLFVEYKNEDAEKTESKLTATGLFAAKEKGVEISRKRAERPRFMRNRALTPAERGTALHMAMQFVDFSKCRYEESAKSELLRLYEQKYLTRAQFESVEAKKISDFVNSAIGQEMLSSQKVCREFKFSVLLPADELLSNPNLVDEKILMQGVIDMYYETDDGIVIVDFKTDRRRPSGDTLKSYSAQLEIYKRALSEIGKKKVKSALLYLVMTNEYIEI